MFYQIKVEKNSVNLIAEKYQLKTIKFNSKEEILPLCQNRCLRTKHTKNLSTYTPITDEQILHYKENTSGFIDKDYIICITDKDDQVDFFCDYHAFIFQSFAKSQWKFITFWMVSFTKQLEEKQKEHFYLIGIHPECKEERSNRYYFQRNPGKTFKKKGEIFRTIRN